MLYLTLYGQGEKKGNLCFIHDIPYRDFAFQQENLIIKGMIYKFSYGTLVLIWQPLNVRCRMLKHTILYHYSNSHSFWFLYNTLCDINVKAQCAKNYVICLLFFSWKHVVVLNTVVVGICLIFARFFPQIGSIIRFVFTLLSVNTGKNNIINFYFSWL